MDQVKILPSSAVYHTCTKGLLQLGGKKTENVLVLGTSVLGAGWCLDSFSSHYRHLAKCDAGFSYSKEWIHAAKK